MTPESLIAETLTWCAELFGTSRVRFVRPLEPDGWIVHALQRGGVVSHHPDYAEVAMAYMIGLGRQPLLVERPRIIRVDGNDVRPIALRSYLGIPVICQDRLVGVVECAGDLKREARSGLNAARQRLEIVAQRLLFDPSLEPLPSIVPETICTLSSAFCCAASITLTRDDLLFLAAIRGSMTISEVAAASGIASEHAMTMVVPLVEQGVLELVSPPDLSRKRGRDGRR